MGGSFNPPTLAHYMLMKYAIDAINAECGYFVPVSDAYLRRKMRHSHPPIVLSSELRIKMLQAMCYEDNKMKLCDKEIGTIEARTLPTLKSFKQEFPECELYFVMGDDKLELLSHLTEKGKFFETSNVILYSRKSGGNRRKSKESQSVVRTHQEYCCITTTRRCSRNKLFANKRTDAFGRIMRGTTPTWCLGNLQRT